MKKISVIIPTLNEAETIGELLSQVCSEKAGFDEVIICDGGSQDKTLEICKPFPCQIVELNRASRGLQLHRGAKTAKGEILFFLHADSRLPQNTAHCIREALKNEKIIAGGFSKVFDHKHFLLRGGVGKCKLRLRILGTISGDQGLFVRKNIYDQTGGYPEIRVMEEFFLCRKLRKKGKLILLPDQITTSARRFLKKGVLRCYLRMALVSTLFYLRFPPPAF